MLLVPLCLMLDRSKAKESSVMNALKTTAMFAGFWGALLYASFFIMGRESLLMDASTYRCPVECRVLLAGESWSFLWATYGFILSVPELTPNMGLFWYFFTEMFEHFRVFFVCTFQVSFGLLPIVTCKLIIFYIF